MKRLDKITYEFSEYSNKKTKVLPLLTYPYPEELFSSWLLRSCYKFEIKPHSFSKFLWDGIAIWNRDIDKSLKHESLIEFCNLNVTPFEVGIKTTLKSFEGILFSKLNENGSSDFINTAGIYHRKRKQHALMYCPICLKSNKYFKITWRVSLITCCTKCKVYLKDECPNCRESIVPFRLNIGTKGIFNPLFINYCWNCKADLTKFKSKNASKKILKFTREIEKLLFKKGKSNKLIVARIIFLKRVLVSNRALISYLKQKRVCEIYSVEKPTKNIEFERLDISKRLEIIKGIVYFLSDWPKSFNLFIKESQLNYSEIVTEKRHKECYPNDLLAILFPKN